MYSILHSRCIEELLFSRLDLDGYTLHANYLNFVEYWTVPLPQYLSTGVRGLQDDGGIQRRFKSQDLWLLIEVEDGRMHRKLRDGRLRRTRGWIGAVEKMFFMFPYG